METNHQHHFKGYLFATGAALAWGVSGAIAKSLMKSDFHPFELLLFRSSIGALAMFLWIGISNPKLLKVKLSDLPYFAVLGIIGFSFNQGAYYTSLTMVGVAYAMLIQYLAPVLLMIYGVITKTEQMTTRKITAAALAVGGCVIMAIGGDSGFANVSLRGTLFAFGSTLGFAFYSSFGKRGLAKYDPRTSLAYSMLFSGISWILFCPIWKLDFTRYGIKEWGIFLYLGTLSQVIPFGLFLASLRYLEASRTTLAAMSEPAIGGISARIILGETMNPLQIMGGGIILFGVILLMIPINLKKRLLDFKT